MFACCLALVVSCSGTAPTPTPRDLTAVLEALALRGATIHQAVAGDAGCPGVPLHGNAVRLELTLQQDGGHYSVYLFRWRRPAQYDAAAGQFDECLAVHARQAAEGEVEALEMAPWRAYGRGWSEDLRTALAAALRAAGAEG